MVNCNDCGEKLTPPENFRCDRCFHSHHQLVMGRTIGPGPEYDAIIQAMVRGDGSAKALLDVAEKNAAPDVGADND